MNFQPASSFLRAKLNELTKSNIYNLCRHHPATEYTVRHWPRIAVGLLSTYSLFRFRPLLLTIFNSSINFYGLLVECIKDDNPAQFYPSLKYLGFLVTVLWNTLLQNTALATSAALNGPTVRFAESLGRWWDIENAFMAGSMVFSILLPAFPMAIQGWISPEVKYLLRGTHLEHYKGSFWKTVGGLVSVYWYPVLKRWALRAFVMDLKGEERDFWGRRMTKVKVAVVKEGQEEKSYLEGKEK